MRRKKNRLDPKEVYRYEKQTNTFFIDIKIDFYREIYNAWDFSPLSRSDLDDDLFDYLESCGRDIPKRSRLCIMFHLPEKIKEKEKEKNSILGYKNYFLYKIKRLSQEIRSARRRLIIYFIFGVLFIFLGNLLHLNIPDRSVFYFVIEGLFIGGWVLFWELFSILFFKFRDFRDRKALLCRLRDSEIKYNYTNP